MKDFCYEIMVNYDNTTNAKVDNFFKKLLLGDKGEHNYYYQKCYESYNYRSERSYINSILLELYRGVVYLKTKFLDMTDKEITKRVIFGLWMYRKSDFNKLKRCINTVFNGLDIEYSIELAFKNYLKDVNNNSNTSEDCKYVDGFPIRFNLLNDYEKKSMAYEIAKRKI